MPSRFPIRSCIAALLVGAITTILVSWGFAACTPFPRFASAELTFPSDTLQDGFVTATQHASTGCIDRSWDYFLPGMDLTRLGMPGLHYPLHYRLAVQELGQADDWGELPEMAKLDPPPVWRGWERATGWPLRSTWHNLDLSTFPSEPWNASFGLRLGTRPVPGLRDPTFHPIILPLLPIWRGFIINTLFYAAAWFALFLGLKHLNRVRRRRAGRCQRCGYLRAGLPTETPCPECAEPAPVPLAAEC